MKALVTGSKGQLGQELKRLSESESSVQFTFLDKEELDITDLPALEKQLVSGGYDYCINCAAYTAVDLAETESEQAFAINKSGAENIAIACRTAGVKCIHISTDFVFDGNQQTPYKETDQPNPPGVYGQSKFLGELAVMRAHPEAIIIRTSWLYSSFGKNFVKTIANLSFRKDELGVVYDQIGTPTYAADLAVVVMKLIGQGIVDWQPGIYHYSNEGVASWYDLAVSIVEMIGSDCKVKAIETWQYPTAAKRAHYTVLHKQKIKDYLQLDIPHWGTSLKKCLEILKEENNYG